MSRMDDRIMDAYSGLASALNRINAEAPEIYGMYEETRELLKQEQALTREAREEVKRLSKTLKQKIADADRLKEEYRTKIEELNQLQATAREQADLWRQKIMEAEQLRDQIMNAEPLLNYRLDDLVKSFDYNESDTVAAMYQKYRGVGPVVIRRPNWTVDTAFLVRSVMGTQVIGISFKDGVPVSGGSTPRAGSLCKIFHGPSQRDIFRYVLKNAGEPEPEKPKRRRRVY